MIQDSGERREFSTGAVRDIDESKGRCDLLPLDIVEDLVTANGEFTSIAKFLETGGENYIHECIAKFSEGVYGNSVCTAILEVSKHFADGAKKYGEHNWEKGIPCHSYVDSAVRHLIKYCRGDSDEPHDRAFVWNLLCLLWTMKHKPELNDLPFNTATLTIEEGVVSYENDTESCTTYTGA